jgi:hypothetical protein
MIVDDLYTELTGDSTLVAALHDATSIYPAGEILQDEDLPYLVYRMIGGNPEYSRDSEAGIASCRIQIDSYAASYRGAKAIADLVRQSISGQKATFGASTLVTIMLEDETDLTETPVSGEERGPGRIAQDYVIWYPLAIPS